MGINANILILDVHANFGIELNRAVRHNAMMANRVSFNIGPLLLKLEKQFSLSRLAEHNNLQQSVGQSGASLIDIVGKGKDNSSSVATSGEIASQETANNSSAPATLEGSALDGNSQVIGQSSDAGSSSRETDQGSVGPSSNSNSYGETITSYGTSSYGGDGKARMSSGGGSARIVTSEKETSNHSRGPKTDGETFYNPTTMPAHLSEKSAHLPQITPLRVVREARVSDTFSTSNATAPNTSPSEAQVMELWKKWLRLCKSPVLDMKAFEPLIVRDMEDTYTSLFNLIASLSQDLGAINALKVSFDQLEAKHRERTNAKLAAFSERRSGGISTGSNKNLEVFAVDKGLGLCRTVFALKANELLMMYHPFTGRKHVQLIGCANFSSYSDATENLESRLKPLIASVNLESHEKIVYNNLPKNRAGRLGYIVDQILLGTEFYNLQKETAVAVESA